MDPDQIIRLLETLKTDIINSMQAAGANATGQTAKALTITRNDPEFQLQIPGYMQLLETGRPPTGANPIAGNPPMIQRIQAWCQAKGIPDKAVWAIKKSIDKNGYKGKPGILTGPMGDDNINLRLDPVLELITEQITTILSGNLD